MLDIKTVKVPANFEETCRFLCPFCNREIRQGSIEGKPYVIHADLQTCKPMNECDDVYQFMLVINLKHKADAGQLERN